MNALYSTPYYYGHSSRNFPVTWLSSLVGPWLSFSYSSRESMNFCVITCNSQNGLWARCYLRSPAACKVKSGNLNKKFTNASRMEWAHKFKLCACACNCDSSSSSAQRSATFVWLNKHSTYTCARLWKSYNLPCAFPLPQQLLEKEVRFRQSTRRSGILWDCLMTCFCNMLVQHDWREVKTWH